MKVLAILAVLYSPNLADFPKWKPEPCGRARAEMTVQDLRYISHLVNSQITYVEDDVDYWQTPKETEERGAGDCEDLAILKKSMLRRFFEHQDAEVVVAVTRYTEILHAVLRVFMADGNSYILDNLEGDVLTEAEFKRRYRAVYAISDCGWRRL